MGKRNFIFILSSVFILFSCEIDGIDGSDNGSVPDDGNIVISFGSIDTKSSADGDMLSDIWIWITPEGSNQLKYFRHKRDIVEVKSDTVKFERVERGRYSMYVVANFSNQLGRFNDYTPSETKPVSSIVLDDKFKKITLSKIENGVPPVIDKNDGKLPLSLVKHFSVAAGDNHINAELKRVCGRISVLVRNLSPEYKVIINKLSLSKSNPKSGYLFSNNHEVPESEPGFTPFYEDFVPFTEDNGKSYASIGPMQDAELINQLLYETGQNVDMNLTIEGAIFNTNESGDILDAAGLPVEPIIGEITETVDYCYDISTVSSEPSAGGFYVITPYASDSKLAVLANSTVSLSGITVESDGAVLVNKNRNCVWQIDGTTLINLGVNSPLTVVNHTTASLGVGDSSFDINSSRSGGYTIRTSASYYIRPSLYYDYLRVNGDNVVFEASRIQNTPTDADYRWLFYSVSEYPRTVTKQVIVNGVRSFDYSGNVQVINEYGTAVPLTHICRNQDVKIIVNLSYNPFKGEFDYVIEPWEERNMYTEFD